MSKNTNLSFLTDYITADITNGRIGINNASPAYAFDVTGIARTSTSTYLATASGNVGIGTSSPAGISTYTTLDIRGATGGGIKMGVSASSTPFNLQQAGTDAYLNNVANGAMLLYTNDTERMRITSGGVVQIGATSLPSGASADSGSMFINSNLFIGNSNGTTGYAFRFDGFANALYASWTSASGVDVGGVYLNYGGTSWTANSDERLKDINSKIENAVDKLKTLRAINYSWKSDETKKENLGLIAQDVEKVFPEVIGINKDGYLGVRYTELIPVLVKAIQELKAEIETLKNK